MGLTTIPEKSEASIGREKRDRPRPLPYDERYETTAAQFERLKTAVRELAEAVGLEDGSTVGSLERLKAVEASITTEDATPASLYLDAITGNAQFEILVSARESTLLAAGDYAIFSYRAVRSANSEGVVTVAAVAMHADTGPGVSPGGWAISIQDDGNGQLEVRVTGAASATVDWKAVVRRWVT